MILETPEMQEKCKGSLQLSLLTFLMLTFTLFFSLLLSDALFFYANEACTTWFHCLMRVETLAFFKERDTNHQASGSLVTAGLTWTRT